MSEPKVIFIIPYRDRKNEKKEFINIMYPLINSSSDYKVYFIHQKDKNPFNRGAMKNAGFIILKEMYKNYENISFVFNDVDTIPKNNNLLNYETKKGIIKHFYGYQHTLGGIVSINGFDFEKSTGFPNCWGWGFEDIVLQDRCLKSNLLIDRSQFYNINDKNFIHCESNEGSRVICENEVLNRKNNFGWDSIKDISNIKYEIDETDENMINVLDFNIPIKYTDVKYGKHNKNTKIEYSNKRKNNLLMNNILKLN
tara:strand:- start:16532 stop:17293 length:762 start_codon:yes stop_codon:yes gene_type:complete